MKITLHDGPFDGTEIEATDPSQIVGVPVDSNLQHSLGPPFAQVLYQRTTGSDYRFLAIQCLPGNAFQSTFVDGPVAGVRRAPSPARYGRSQMDVLLDADGHEYA